MTRQEIETLLKAVYSTADYEYLFQMAEKEQDFFNTVWEMACEQPDSQSWRLLWILDHATEKRNDFIFPILDELYKRVLKTKNESYIRQTMKLILRCPILDEYASELIDRCIIWMNNPDAKISSQCLGLEFFFQTCQLYPEMKPELIAYIDNILELSSPSAGYRLRLSKTRSELE
jgi:hypothetical protein